MAKMASKLYPRIFFTALFVAIIVLAYYITRPFLTAVFTATIIAYLSYPIYRKSLKFIKNKNIAAFLVSIIIILLFTVPFVIVIGAISKEAYQTYYALNNAQQNLTIGSNFMQIVCGSESWSLCKGIKSLTNILPENNLDFYVQNVIQRIVSFIASNGYEILVSIPSIILNFFVMMFVIFYLLKDGEKVGARIRNIIPLKESHKNEVINRFHDVTSEVFYANIFVAVIQGVVGTIGFFLLGVPSPVLWGAVMMVFALIPYFGTAIIWLPAALNLMFIGYLQNDNSSFVRGIILIIYGILFISTIDNILKPKLIGSKANIHPVLVLLGVLGGLNIFGFIGVILGPLMLAILMTFIDIYEKEKSEIDKYF